jgi:hypothetical protein
LEPYKGAAFEVLHAPGAGIVTASGVPALFGVSRWATARAYAEHLLGRVPLVVRETELMVLGRDLQEVALLRASRATGLAFRPVRHFTRHPTIERFIASPDGLVRRGRRTLGIAEVKLVTPDRFLVAWGDGPPVDVRLQVQAQLACTGAPAGWIVAMLPRMRGGWFDLEVVVYEEPRHDKLAELEEHVAGFLDDLDRNVLPPIEPDPRNREVVATLYRVDPSKVIELDGPATAQFDRWREGRDLSRKGKALCAEAQAWFAAAAPEASRILVRDRGAISVSEIEGANGRYRRYHLSDTDGP